MSVDGGHLGDHSDRNLNLKLKEGSEDVLRLHSRTFCGHNGPGCRKYLYVVVW